MIGNVAAELLVLGKRTSTAILLLLGTLLALVFAYVVRFFPQAQDFASHASSRLRQAARASSELSVSRPCGILSDDRPGTSHVRGRMRSRRGRRGDRMSRIMQVVSGFAPAVSGHDARVPLVAGLAAIESMATGRPVRL